MVIPKYGSAAMNHDHVVVLLSLGLMDRADAPVRHERSLTVAAAGFVQKAAGIFTFLGPKVGEDSQVQAEVHLQPRRGTLQDGSKPSAPRRRCRISTCRTNWSLPVCRSRTAGSEVNPSRGCAGYGVSVPTSRVSGPCSPSAITVFRSSSLSVPGGHSSVRLVGGQSWAKAGPGPLRPRMG